jgi:Flp pilus assembly pilin Flp
MSIAAFFRSESGAITVDWVVLTAGIAGLGLATVAVVSGGVENLSRDSNAALRGGLITSNFMRTLASIDFSAGNLGGWLGGEIRDFGGEMGEVLFIPQRGTAALTFDVPPGSSEAMMEFSLYGGDTLDGEDAVVSVNGVPVVIATGTHGRMTIEIPRVDGTMATAEVLVEQINLGGGTRYPNAGDSMAQVSIRVDDPPPNMTLSVFSNNSHGHNGNDEFWAIDNVDVAAR